MMKMMLGLVAAIGIAVAGLFGFELYTQQRIAAEIDTAFDKIRADGGKASHGKVSFNLLKHNLAVSDIAVETAGQPASSAKISLVTALGVRQTDGAHFSADSIDLSDVEFGTGSPAAPNWRLTYKGPHITVKDFSGPTSLKSPPPGSSGLDLVRSALEQFAGVTASSVTARDLAGTLSFGTSAAGGGNGEFSYATVALEGIKDGKIASTRVDGANFTFNTQAAGKTDKIVGNLASAASYDLDMTALAALLNPQSTEDRTIRVYRQATTGAYTFSSLQGVRVRIDGVTVDDVGLRPSKLQLPALLAMMPAPGAVATPAQAREMMEKIAGVYEGLHIGGAEMRGMSVDTPQGPLKLSAIRYSMDNGKGDFAIEGLDGRTPNGPFQVGRLALKSFDIAGLMRRSVQLATPGQPPSPEQALAFLQVLEGAEIKSAVAPYKTTGKSVTIDTISLNWGQFVGAIPTKAHVVAKLAGPVDPTDPAQQALRAAGLDKVGLDLDLGAGWTEGSGSFALSPATIELAGLLKASAGLSLAHVPRGAISFDAAQAMTMAAQIEAGPVELSLHDAGAIDVAVAQFARSQNLSREAARAAIIDSIKTTGEKIAAANPDGAAAVEAVTRFVQTPGQTLLIKLTPLGKVPALKLMQLLKTDPLIALAQFRIEASTGL